MAEYHVETFGCRANQADSYALEAGLREQGMTPAAAAAQADVIVLNTCSVTAQAERTARAFLRRARRENPAARILITGCYAQRAPQEVGSLPGVHAVVGNSHKPLLAELSRQSADFVPVTALQPAATAWERGAVLADGEFAHSDLAVSETAWRERALPRAITRPSLKVQDGCANRCSFCIIPATRGPSRSTSLQACLGQIEAFAAGGGIELVLSGINLGRWSRDLTPPLTLEDLIEAILDRTSLPRLRLSSIEPMDWTPRLLDLFCEHAGGHSPRIARHAHLPLQSGADSILRAMYRRYRPWHYAEKLRILREGVPDAAIGADVMVGFPGETEALFEESFAFIGAQPFTYLHLFPFSPRPGTAAGQLGPPPRPGVVEERMERLRGLMAGKNRAFQVRFLGRELPAVTLHTPPGEAGTTRALADNFLELRLSASLASNQNVRALVTGLVADALICSVAY